MVIHGHLWRAASRWPDKLALVCGAEGLTFGELAGEAERLAAGLGELGVRPGDRVALFCPNGRAAAVASFAVLRLGAVLVPINVQSKTRKLAYLLSDATPTCLVAEAALARVWAPALSHGSSVRAVVATGTATLPPDLLEAAGPPLVRLSEVLASGSRLPEPTISGQDLAAIIYTSGSAGTPKGVMLSHFNMVSALESVVQYLPIGEDDVIASALSLTYSYGLYQLLHAARVGARLLLTPSFAFPTEIVDTMVRQKATVFPGVPTFFASLAALDHAMRADLSQVRIVTSAAAPLAPRTTRDARALFPRAKLYCMYGLTECKRVTYLPPEDLDRKPGSVGRGMPNQELFLVDEEGRRLPPGSEGELVVRGNHVMRGYWNRPAETAERLRVAPGSAEVSLHTGDLFRMDDDGYLYFLGRKDDIIKSRGEKISPREIEDVILEHQGALEVVAIGVGDDLYGQTILAYVVPRPGYALTPELVIRHCRSRLEATHLPGRVEIVASLPRNNSGKIDKALIKQAAAGEGSADALPSGRW